MRLCSSHGCYCDSNRFNPRIRARNHLSGCQDVSKEGGLSRISMIIHDPSCSAVNRAFMKPNHQTRQQKPPEQWISHPLRPKLQNSNHLKSTNLCTAVPKSKVPKSTPTQTNVSLRLATHRCSRMPSLRAIRQLLTQYAQQSEPTGLLTQVLPSTSPRRPRRRDAKSMAQ